MNDIKILVCCHKKAEVPEDVLYLPVHVGALHSSENLRIQKDCDVNDEKCDNISNKNNVYCEMTAAYWAWKNIEKTYCDIQYIGLCHYRRYFDFNWNFFDECYTNLKYFYKKCKSFMTNTIYVSEPTKVIESVDCYKFRDSTKQAKKTIYKYDAISTYPCRITNCNTEMFFQVIGRKYIDLLTKIIDEKYPVYGPAYHAQLESNKIYAQNMSIMKTDIYKEYCEFVFSVLRIHLEETTKLNICQDPLRELSYDRVSGYLAEILTSTFIRYANTKYSVGFVGKYFVD